MGKSAIVFSGGHVVPESKVQHVHVSSTGWWWGNDHPFPLTNVEMWGNGLQNLPYHTMGVLKPERMQTGNAGATRFVFQTWCHL